MQFDALLGLVGSQGWFDLASVVQLTGLPGESFAVQLHRWCKAGKLLPLRRGMYAFAERYRRMPINTARLANELYAPSYLSTHWALAFYGLIPEKVVTYTSVTPRVPRTFVNAFGTFAYRHLKPAAFFGYRRAVIDGASVLLAEPEKALLDFWHLAPGRWDLARMTEMRFQNFELVQPARLASYADRCVSPRLTAAVRVWSQVAETGRDGTVAL